MPSEARDVSVNENSSARPPFKERGRLGTGGVAKDEFNATFVHIRECVCQSLQISQAERARSILPEYSPIPQGEWWIEIYEVPSFRSLECFAKVGVLDGTST